MCALSFMYARVLALHACQGGHAYVRLCVCVCVFARCCSLRVWGFSLAEIIVMMHMDGQNHVPYKRLKWVAR